MSNLWFFRLRRVEQQRRRSSGEQSAGSASVSSLGNPNFEQSNNSSHHSNFEGNDDNDNNEDSSHLDDASSIETSNQNQHQSQQTGAGSLSGAANSRNQQREHDQQHQAHLTGGARRSIDQLELRPHYQRGRSHSDECTSRLHSCSFGGGSHLHSLSELANETYTSSSSTTTTNNTTNSQQSDNKNSNIINLYQAGPRPTSLVEQQESSASGARVRGRKPARPRRLVSDSRRRRATDRQECNSSVGLLDNEGALKASTSTPSTSRQRTFPQLQQSHCFSLEDGPPQTGTNNNLEEDHTAAQMMYSRRSPSKGPARNQSNAKSNLQQQQQRQHHDVSGQDQDDSSSAPNSSGGTTTNRSSRPTKRERSSIRTTQNSKGILIGTTSPRNTNSTSSPFIVPQVTIIRSDSTSSFIPLSPTNSNEFVVSQYQANYYPRARTLHSQQDNCSHNKNKVSSQRRDHQAARGLDVVSSSSSRSSSDVSSSSSFNFNIVGPPPPPQSSKPVVNLVSNIVSQVSGAAVASTIGSATIPTRSPHKISGLAKSLALKSDDKQQNKIVINKNKNGNEKKIINSHESSSPLMKDLSNGPHSGGQRLSESVAFMTQRRSIRAQLISGKVPPIRGPTASGSLLSPSPCPYSPSSRSGVTGNPLLAELHGTDLGAGIKANSCDRVDAQDQMIFSGNSNSLLSPDSASHLGSQIGADSLDNLASLIPRVRVRFYNSGNTLKERLQMYLIKDHRLNIYVRLFKLILKVLACYLYVSRVMFDRGPNFVTPCYGCVIPNATTTTTTMITTTTSTNNQNTQQQQQPTAPVVGVGVGAVAPGSNEQVNAPQQQQQFASFSSSTSNAFSKFDAPYDGPINFRALFWVDRGPIIWCLQTSIAVICFTEALLMQYLTYKNSIFSIISFHFVLEIITNTPFIISIFWTQLRTLFVPGFLNCWLAKQCLEAMLNDISIVRQSSVLSHRLTILSATVFCLIFTSACGFQHTQRSGGRNYISIFESFYFVVVTFSTVGYGDFKPETWPSQLFIMVMICVALIVLPTQFEQLAYFWIERKKLGASYAHHSTRHEKHVVVCSTTLRADTIMDFLNEFYAHPLLQTFSVVLLSPCELDTTMKLVLQTPTWNNRVVYIQGSALKANDLIRARMQSAEACFILAARNYNDRSAADEHTILRSWAIRDFSPYVPQYVQIFRTENKIHVAFAEHVVCDDEFKYALLANNCLIPGTSTLVTLLLHTTSQQQQHDQSRHQARRMNNKKKRRRTRRRKGNFLSRLLAWPFNPSHSNSKRRRGGAHAAGGIHAAPTADNIEAGDNLQSSPGAANYDNPNNENENNQGQPDLNQQQASEWLASSSSGSSDDDVDDYSDSDSEHSNEPEWRRLYGRCSANEIYHIRLADSRFFGEYQGKSFTYASFHSHRKFGVALIGVQTDMRGTWPIMLNPGPSYVLKSSDILFYINVTKEENSALMPMRTQAQHVQQSSSFQQLLRSRAASTSQTSDPGAGTRINNSQIPAVPEPESPHKQQQQQEPSYNSMDQAAKTTAAPNQLQTEIRVEHSEKAATQRSPSHFEGVTVKKHSIADGAGLVARSFCSMAGLSPAQASQCDRLLQTHSSAQPGGGRLAAGATCSSSTPSSSFRRRLRGGASDTMTTSNKRDSSGSAVPAGAAVGSSTQQQRGGSLLGVAGAKLQGGASGQKHHLSHPLGSSNLNVSSTFELASLASRLRKGSNMSINSSKSRDVSPTRLKQVVSGLVVKMKRVKLGKSLTHLTIPRMDLGGGSSASSTESFVNARGRRPSIAPVPAMMGESEEQDSDHEREQESYFSMAWQSSSESSPIVKKFVFCTTYIGVSPTLCYMLQRKKPACCLQLIMPCEHCPNKNARQYNWPARCIILASDFASNGIYNFLVPLRAHFHNPSELRPIVLLLERKPNPQFIDAISWFPMVYWMPGSIDNLDDLIKAGINLAHSMVVTNKESTNSAEEDYLADCNTIVAVQTMFKMFPSVGIITELSQSSNMRFMQFRAHDLLFGPFSLANLDRALTAGSRKRSNGSTRFPGFSSSKSSRHRSRRSREGAESPSSKQHGSYGPPNDDGGLHCETNSRKSDHSHGMGSQTTSSNAGNGSARDSRGRNNQEELHRDSCAASAAHNGGGESDPDNAGGQQQQAAEMSAISKAIRDRIQLRKLHSQLYNKQLAREHAYKYRLPFAAGNVFSASMLDTLLYQAFVKDYMITMVRLLLGIDQAPGSGFLSSMRITRADLWIRTYGRLYQRLCSTTCEIPLGIYRTEPLESKRRLSSTLRQTSAGNDENHNTGDACSISQFGAFMSQQASYEHATEELERVEISNMVRNRLEDLGMLVSDYDDSPANRNNTFSYVIINPNCDISLREGDIIYLIRPSPIHSRKLFINRAKSFRHCDATNRDNPIFGPNHQTQDQHQTTGAAHHQNEDCSPQTSSDCHHPNQRNQTPHHQHQQSGHIKSCLSEGDFNEILIKVNDQDQYSTAAGDGQRQHGHGHGHHHRCFTNGADRTMSPLLAASESYESLRGSANSQRRRSSCSDADEQQSQQRWRDSLA